MKKLMVLDGNSIVNRAFYGVSQTLTTRAGQPTNAVLGFLNILNKLLQEENPDALCITFDRKAPTFRHLAYAEYKAQRKGMPEELASQIPLLKQVLTAMNIPLYEMDGWEADDLIGTISVRCGSENWQCVIVTGDKDSLQLVTPTTTVKLVSTRMGRTTTRDMTPESFYEEYGFAPIHIVDLKALMGDASDNIAGVKGVGEKTAMALVQRYQSIDALYAAMPTPEMAEGVPAKAGIIKKLEEGAESARMSFDLATIRTDAPIDFAPADALRQPPDNDALYNILNELEFTKLIDKYGVHAPADAAARESAEVFEGTCSIEIVQDFAHAQELLTVWRELDEVNVLALPHLDVVCVDFAQKEDERCAAVLLETNIEQFETVLNELFAADIKKVTHGLKDLCRRALEQGIRAAGFVFDTEVAAYLLDPSAGSYPLERLVEQYCGCTPSPAAEYLSEGSFGSLSDPVAPMATLTSHCAWLGILHDCFEKKLTDLGMDELYQTIDLPLCPVLAQMEHAGIMVDKAALQEYGAMLSQRIDTVQAEIYALAGEEFNINSPKQLGAILFERLGLPAVKKTKTGYSTNAEVLDKLRGTHPIIAHILDYRQLTKLKSTYVDGLGKVIAPDGRIHTSFQNTVTATGRLSSTEPNLQNIPVRTELGAQLRRMFVAPAGKVLVDADYSQIELRLLACMAQDAAMIDGFHSGEDIHTITASQVFGVAQGDVTPLMRRSAKAVNFGIVYGISPFSLAQDINVSVAQAKDYMEKYFLHYAGVRDYMERIVKQAKTDGYVTTLYGRRRWIPEIKSSNFNTRSFGERVALNAPIQGTAADIIKLAMIRVDHRLAQENLSARLILQVHDELIVECDEGDAQQVESLLKQEMEAAAQLAVTLIADTKSGNSWADAH